MSDEKTDDVVFRSRWIVCDDCGCSTTIENEEGVPDENDWDGFGRCLVCGSSQFHWNADEQTQRDSLIARVSR